MYGSKKESTKKQVKAPSSSTVVQPTVVRFTVEQCQDLREYGLVQEQIDELEAVLPAVRVMIADAPRLADVRDALQAILGAVTQLEKLLIGTRSGSTIMREALARIQVASHAARGPANVDQLAVCALHRLRQAIERAQTELQGHAQRRSNAAAVEPIRRIHDALLLGWVKAARGKVMGAFNAKPSRSASSTFRSVVGTCYEAATGKMDHDPERAIKGYL
jgi:hypothetical protein